MGRPKREAEVDKELDYDEIESYLLSSTLPDRLKGNRGKKANFKRQVNKFDIKDGTLILRPTIKEQGITTQSEGK